MSRSAVVFARNMRLLRKSHGMTLEQVAKAVGTSRSTVYRWEAEGEKFNFPTPEFLDKIADCFAIPIADLFAKDALKAKKAGMKLEDAIVMLNENISEIALTMKRDL